MRYSLLAVTAATLAFASPAYAAMLGGGGCSTDLTLAAGSSLVNCYGRQSGNTLNNSSNVDINVALTALGYAGPQITYSNVPSGNILSNLNSGRVVNFPGLLNGTAFIGIHYGNGNGGPGNSTTFYRINAVNLDTIGLTLNASSTATLFAVQTPAVPEPATWAMMIAGFGLVGGVMRRRRVSAALA